MLDSILDHVLFLENKFLDMLKITLSLPLRQEKRYTLVGKPLGPVNARDLSRGQRQLGSWEVGLRAKS